MADIEHHSARHTNGEADPLESGSAGGRFGGAMNAEPGVIDAARRKKPTGMMILVAVVSLAIGGIVAMRALMGTGLLPGSDRDLDLDGSLERAKDIKREIDEAMGALEPPPSNGWTPVVENPFKPEPPPPAPPPDRSKFERAAGRIELGALMVGSTPRAVINRRSRGVGDVFLVDLPNDEGTVSFRLKQITSNSVTVEATGADPPFETVVEMKRGG